jgi:hypothetical protein
MMNTCIQCGQEHDKRGVYCSKRCIDKAYRDRKSGKTNALPVVDRKPKVKVKQERIDIPVETGPKLKWCNFCGASLDTSPMLQFCNKEHQEDYYRVIKSGGALKLKIDSRTIIETRKYNRVQELIETMLSRNSYISFTK